MKRKLVPMLLCCLALSFTAEAQFFKKLKKAAKNAAERTIMNRTDEEVSKGTDNVLDSLTKSGKRNRKGKSKTVGETGENTARTQEGQAQKDAIAEKMGGLFGGGSLEGVPEVYEFSYKATMKISSAKDETLMTYWFEPGQSYFGSMLNDDRTHGMTVMDLGNKLMVMFIDDGQRKTAMTFPASDKTMGKLTKEIEEENRNASVDAKISPLPDKTILGYNCKGYQVTTKEGVTKLWVTNEAPVGYLEGIADINELPESILPMDGNSMFMEMQFESTKGQKHNFSMLCTELKEEHKSLAKEEYTPIGGF